MSGFRKMTEEERVRFEEEAKKVLNVLHEQARKEIETGHEIPAMLYVMTVGGDVQLVMLQDAMNAGKDIAEQLVKGIQKKKGVLATIFMSEAWMIELPKEEAEQGKPMPRPSEHPNRVEAVIWVVESPVGDLFGRAVISRNPDRLGDLDVPKFDPDSSETYGRFAGGFANATPEQFKSASTATLQSYFNFNTIKGKQ